VKSRNIEEWIGEGHGGSTMVEEEINEIGQIRRSKKQNEDGVNSGTPKTASEKIYEYQQRSEKVEKCIGN
jgi:hypothetical protein